MRSVLVVEDEAIIALDLTCSIEALGYRVLGPASDGAEAQRIAKAEHPDLTLMDVTILGPQDGIPTAQAITRDTPARVVFLTALTDNETKTRAEALHPAAYLTKPCSARQMQDVLRDAFATVN